MTTVFLLLAALALFHWIYESTLAPSFRLDLRFRLFALRDELRALKIDLGSDLADKHFHYLQDSVNTLIYMLNRIDVGSLHAVTRELDRNPKLRHKIELRTKTLDDCNIPEARDIRNRSLEIASRALLVNMGGLVIYVLPVVLVIAGVAALRRQYRKHIKDFVSVPEPEFHRVMPCADGDGSLATSHMRGY